MFKYYNAEVTEETIPMDQRKSLSQDDVRNSGILEIMEEVVEQLREEFLGGPVLEKTLYVMAVDRILDRARSLKDVKGESSMSHEKVIDFLKPYAVTVRSEEYFFTTLVYINLKQLKILVNTNEPRVLVVGERGRNIFSYEDTSYLKAILLLDAACDALFEMLQKLFLEMKSFLQAQEIYLNYAGMVADTMTSKYQGKTRVAHKDNRTTLHFYLSDTEKAVITFFQKDMPWTLPEPPTDPQSLRKTCQEEGSPFFIVSLSKRDRRALNPR